ncbi:MAG: hypothetical protein HXS43_13565 [Theionarchaea archaeon]|nr:hypothetical protein [Theionarchaea archaeon]
MAKTIRFSHTDYEKFRRIQKRPPFTARLLQVFTLEDNELTDAFREYDTKYYGEQGIEYYPLRGQTWIVLLFEAENGLLFTTARSLNQEKLRYYRNAQGEEFNIVRRGTSC